MFQMTLFDTRPYTEFDFPDYMKVYSVYAYDKVKAHKFYKQKKEEAKKKKDPDIYYSINPYDVIQAFIIRNKDGTKKHLKDEKHIFRRRSLDLIYQEIGKRLLAGEKINLFECCIKDFLGVKVYYDYYDNKPYEYKTSRDGWKDFKGEEFNNISGELDNTQHLPIYKRLKIHIMLLRLLRQGMTIDKAVKEVKERFKEWLTKKN